MAETMPRIRRLVTQIAIPTQHRRTPALSTTPIHETNGVPSPGPSWSNESEMLHPGFAPVRPAKSGVLTFSFHQAARGVPCDQKMHTGFVRQQLMFWGLILGLWFLL